MKHSKTKRRALLYLAALLASTLPAASQDWPTRPVTLVVPFGAGSATDVVARIVAQGMSESLGRQVVVENVGGAGGMIGSSRVAKAAADGYQLVIGNIGTHAQAQALYRKPMYNAATDFAPVGLTNVGTKILIVRNGLPVRTLPEFIAYAHANQGKMQFGSAGIGSSTHTACLLLNSAIGITATHVPYRGDSAAIEDLIAGRIDFMCEPPTLAVPFIRENNVKAIALLSLNRISVVPDLATAHEQGLENFEADLWQGLFLPKGAPEPIVRRLNKALGETLDAPSVRERYDSLGVGVPLPEQRSPEFLARLVASEVPRWAAIFKAIGLSID